MMMMKAKRGVQVMGRCSGVIFVALLVSFGIEARNTYRRTLVVAAILLRRVTLLRIATVATEKSALPFHPPRPALNAVES